MKNEKMQNIYEKKFTNKENKMERFLTQVDFDSIPLKYTVSNILV